MMTRFFWTLMLALACGLPAARPLLAQEITSPFRYVEATQAAGAYVGWLATSTGESDLGPRSAPLLGARYSIRFGGPVTGEAILSGGPSERTIYGRTIAGGDTTLVGLADTDVFLLLAEAGLRFHLTGPRTWNGLAPFVAASGGLAMDLLGSSEFEEALAEEQRFDFGPGFAVGLGAGTDWFLTERLSARLEARDYVWRLSTPAGLAGTGREETEWTHNFAFTLGAALHF